MEEIEEWNYQQRYLGNVLSVQRIQEKLVEDFVFLIDYSRALRYMDDDGNHLPDTGSENVDALK
jgi:hypothetical protein